jgi:hypothetical protein
MPLSDLLQFLHQARKTGTLIVHGDRYSKKLVVRDGVIVSTASDDPTDYLGQYLLREGRITEDQLRKAIETQQKTRVMLGKILVTVGAIQEADLMTLLVEKAEETIASLFLLADARFEFLEGSVPAEIAVPLHLNIEDALLKGLAWYDELQHIRNVFATSRTVVARTGRSLPPEFQTGASPARRILDLVDGRRSIADICLAVHASEFVVGKLLYLMNKQGYVQVVQRVTPEEAAPARKTFSELLDEASSLLRLGHAEEALRILEEARPLSPHDIALRSLFDEARRTFLQQTVRTEVAPEKVPRLTRPLESLVSEPLSPEEGFILSRVDGSWDVRSIVSLCPFSETEALMHLKRLLDRGLVSLAAPA